MSESATQAVQPERRRASRTALRLSATIREASRGKVEARLIDISTHGCRVEALTGATPDAWVWLNIAGLESQHCRVVWRCDEFVGLEFETPLAEAVLDRLLNDSKQLTEATIGELRNIAVRTHRLATKEPDAEVQRLAELSNRCAVEAVIEGFRMTESAAKPTRPLADPS